MKLLTSKQITVLIALLATGINVLFAQTKGVVADKNTHLPVGYVNIYTSNTDIVRGTNSDENGIFIAAFDFQNLTFSHINYNKITVEKSEINDTIFLTPIVNLLQEIVVTNARPDWIENKLKEVVRQKKKKYRTETKDFEYHYDSYTLSDSSGYAFQSSGNLRIPSLVKKERYFIEPKANIIKYKDESAGTDFGNFRRILYEDFIVYFDEKFINSNDFSQNLSFEDDNLVQLLFTDKKYKDVVGYCILDTLNNVIVEVEQNLGTDYNLKTKTKGILRNYANSKGISYNILEIKVRTSYKKSGNGYYLSESKYKLTQQIVSENKKHKWTYLEAVEAQLFVNDETKINTSKMIVVPKFRYITAIYTKKMQREDAALQNIPKTFEKF
ncbi:MAG: carboxypeptidase-like regulatory domain-containing protein [Tannerellaceae bacterium]|jgi:hypothetical protein|nr:carboxypeptidase-like regulatory domain-containing protein [Tannerellaceae bacterium]